MTTNDDIVRKLGGIEERLDRLESKWERMEGGVNLIKWIGSFVGAGSIATIIVVLGQVNR